MTAAIRKLVSLSDIPRSAAVCFSLIIATASGCQSAHHQEQASTAKVVEGLDAVEGQFPSTIVIDYCTGTVVGKRKVLTAAHCVLQRSTPTLSTYYSPGYEFRFRNSTRAGTAKIVRTKVHESVLNEMSKLIAQGQTGEEILAMAAQAPNAFDLAVVTLDRDIHVLPAKIHAIPITAGTELILQGYGKPYHNSNGPGSTLRYFAQTVKSVSPERLRFLPPDMPKISDFAIIDDGARDAIRALIRQSPNLTTGDSGGAVYIQGEGGLEVAGVNSGGYTRGYINGMSALDYLDAFGFVDNYEVITKLQPPLMHGEYNCARVDNGGEHQEPYSWIQAELAAP